MRRETVLALALLLALAPGAAAQQPAAPPAPAAAPAAATEPEAPAAEAPVRVEVTLGYAGRVPPDGFVPVVVDLVDRGPPVTVTVTLRASEGGTTLLRLGPVELDGPAPRRLVGVVPARPIVESGGLYAEALDAEGRPQGGVVAYPDPVQGRVLVAIDQRGAAPADLSGLRTSEAAAGGPPAEVRWATALVSRAEDLPTSPLGWSAAGAVLLGDLALKDWPDAAARALAAWVVRGGDLIVSVGPRASALRRSALGKHLGEALEPLPDAPPRRDVTAAALLSALGAGGADDAATGAAPGVAPVAELLEGDEVVLDAGGPPLAVRRRHGLGRVTLVAADLWAPPLLHSPAAARALERLLAGASQHAPRARDLFGELAEVRQPARVGPAFAVLIIYALLAGPGVYFVLRARRRGLWLWVAIPAITLGFTALVPLYRLVLKDAESTLVGVRLVEGRAGRAVGVESTDALLFSGSLDPKTLRYEGRDPVAYAVVPSRRARRGGDPDLGAVLGGGAEEATFSLPVALWGARYVAFEATAKVPPVTGGVELTYGPIADEGRDTTAHVRLGWDGPTLRDAVLVYPGAAGALAHRLGDVGSGAEVDAPAAPTSPRDAGGTDLAGVIAQRLLDVRYTPLVERERRAFLVGQVEQRSPLSAAPNVRVRAFATLYAVEVGLGYRDTVPFGAARATREASTVAVVDSGVVDRLVTTRLRLPAAAGRAGQPPSRLRARVTAARSRGVGRLSVEVLDPARGQWRRVLPLPEEADEQEGAGKRLDLDLPDPADLVDPRGEVTFRQRLRRPRADVDDPYAAAVDVAAEWPAR